MTRKRSHSINEVDAMTGEKIYKNKMLRKIK